MRNFFSRKSKRDIAKDEERYHTTPFEGLSWQLQTNSSENSEGFLFNLHPLPFGKLVQASIKSLLSNFNNEETNRIRTAKYNIFTLLPMTIFYQLLRFGNFYFLMIALLQLIPAISDTNGIPTYAVPIVIVITLAAIREYFEDLQRHRSDREENMRMVRVCKGKSIIQKRWQDLKIGEVVKVFASEHFPADLLLLNCADNFGICNVETKNVDGETNIKHKYCLPRLSKIFADDTAAGTAMIKIFYEPPNSSLFHFHGIAKLTSTGEFTNDETSVLNEAESTGLLTLDEKQVLLRGTSLVSTKWMYGCVLYTGPKTRLLMSSNTKSLKKKSRLDLLYSTHAVFIALFQFIFLLVHSSIALVWNIESVSQLQSLLSGNTFLNATFFFKSIGSSLILSAAMLPAELLILWEFNRWLQGKAINKDSSLSATAEETAQARATDLIEEMGNISHVYTDKTGTLTKNLMCLQCIGLGSAIQFGLKQWTTRKSLLSQNVPYLRSFFKKKDDDTSTTTMKPLLERSTSPVYEASSPDELAIVTAASQIGIEFSCRPSLITCEVRVVSSLCLNLFEDVIREYKLSSKQYYEENEVSCEGNGYSLTFPILAVMDFDSVRKRTTIVTRDLNGKILLLCKGADSSLLKISSPDSSNVSSILQQVENFASAGLRTMVFGYKYLSPSDFDDFLEVHRKAKMLTGTKGNAAVTNAFQSIESGLNIIGCTGIEDSLQNFVPDVIQNLKDAGIKIWMLTGDRMETAENIARSINLTNENTCSILVNESDQYKLSSQLKKLERSIGLAALFDRDKTWWNEIDWELLDTNLGEPRSSEKVGLSETVQQLQNVERNTSVLEDVRGGQMGTSTTRTFDTFCHLPDSPFVDQIDKMYDSAISEDSFYSGASANFSPRRHTTATFGKQKQQKGRKTASSGCSVQNITSRSTTQQATKKFSSLLKEVISKDDQTLQPKDFLTTYSSFAIIITGDSFEALRKNLNMKIRFYTLCKHAATVVACRLTPDQKARLINENSAFNPRSSSLAIGDGANDVGMILAANVGIGIVGKEGVEAARASDFSIREFHHLRQLLFVHGRETLRRSCFLIYFCVFRGLYSILVIAFYNYFNVFSNTDVWNLWSKQFINSLFTALPILVVVAYDVYVPHEILVENPTLYRIEPSTLWPYTKSNVIQSCKLRIQKFLEGLYHRMKQHLQVFTFSSKRLKSFGLWIYRWWHIRSQPHRCSCCGWFCLFLWFGFAFWVAIVQLFCILFGLTGPLFPVIGLEFGFPTVGVESLFVAMHPLYVLTAILIPAYFAHSWFTITHITIWGEICLFVVVSAAISFLHPIRTLEGGQPIFGSFLLVHFSLQFYLMLLFALLGSFFPLLFFSGWQNFFKPTINQKIIENLKKGKEISVPHVYALKSLYFSSQMKHETRGYGFAIEPKDPFSELIQDAV
ncbi:putative proton ATPase, partial [Cardiosporidium cionae]